MYLNYCEYIKSALEQSYPAAAIYSNLDPTREYRGGLLVEISEPDAPEINTFISGEEQIRRAVYVTARAETPEAAVFALEKIELKINEIFREPPPSLIAWYIESRGTLPDATGIVSGASFYAFFELHLIERGKSAYKRL